MIFYFTATGNSLYVARRIAEKFGERIESIPAVLRGGTTEFSDDMIGIVCPVYGSEPPYMVRDFLRRVKLNADYVFFVLTYGRSPGVTAEITAKAARDSGVEPSLLRTVRMADNYLPAFDMAKEKEEDCSALTEKGIAAVCVHSAIRGRTTLRAARIPGASDKTKDAPCGASCSFNGKPASEGR